jgi:hypothetical protein
LRERGGEGGWEKGVDDGCIVGRLNERWNKTNVIYEIDLLRFPVHLPFRSLFP